MLRRKKTHKRLNTTTTVVQGTVRGEQYRHQPHIVSSEDTLQPVASPKVFLVASDERHKETVAAVRRHREEIVY